MIFGILGFEIYLFYAKGVVEKGWKLPCLGTVLILSVRPFCFEVVVSFLAPKVKQQSSSSSCSSC